VDDHVGDEGSVTAQKDPLNLEAVLPDKTFGTRAALFRPASASWWRGLSQLSARTKMLSLLVNDDALTGTWISFVRGRPEVISNRPKRRECAKVDGCIRQGQSALWTGKAHVALH
jgi:hypothetical protein